MIGGGRNYANFPPFRRGWLVEGNRGIRYFLNAFQGETWELDLFGKVYILRFSEIYFVEDRDLRFKEEED